MIEAAFASVLIGALVGLILSVLIERLMIPRVPVARPWPAWLIHAGMWLGAHGVVTLILGRPWFSTAAVSAFLLMLVLVNNAKFRALREHFVFQDYEYFTDAIRHPRLYIPFLGWGKFLLAAAGFALAIAFGLWGEATPVHRFNLNGQLGGIGIELVLSAVMLLVGQRARLPLTFDPQRDTQAFGFLAALWRYGESERVLPMATSPFQQMPSTKKTEGKLPHLVAVQSESFFDPRPLCPGIRPKVLDEFDRLKQEAVSHGRLKVPAWGANTVRTEFAFLSGIVEDVLDVHRFNPYRAISAGWEITSLASYLKGVGYRTVCVHPYPASFYQRDRVYPRLGFDEFLDIRAFDVAQRFGPYIGDVAVAEKVASLLNDSREPLFVFVITMENHGPLHLEQISVSDIDELYMEPPPDGCDDLTIYLRHLGNAGKMIARLRQALENCRRPASLCWYGDHVPIMPKVYEIFGAPSGEVEYVIWSNHNSHSRREDELYAHELARGWLHVAGVVQ